MTMRRALITAAILMAVSTSAVAEDQPDAAAPEPQWTEFQSPERGFAVEFPGTPQVTTTPVQGQNPLIQYDYNVGVGDDTAYQVVVLEYPADKAPNPPAPEYFLKVAGAYAKGSGSRLRQKGPATIADRPGYEAVTDEGKSKPSHLLDIVPTGDRVYLLISGGPRNHAGSDDAKRFRDSFRVLGNPPQPPADPSAD